MSDNLDLLGKARQDMMEDMATRGIGAILWDNSTADFEMIPEIVHVSEKDGHERVARIMGLYSYDGTLYLIEEDRAPVNFNDFYNHDSEVKPVVVTLSEDTARRELGDPEKVKGYTTQGRLEEWPGIADCYFEALDEM